MRGARLLLMAVALGAGEPAAQRRDAAARAHWKVVCVDFEDAGYAARAQAIAHAVGEVVFDALGGPRENDPQLVVHLYRDAAAFEDAERERTGGRFARNRAFSFRADLTSHLVFEPFWPESIRARLGLPGQMQRLIAHEAAHLAVYASCKGRGVFHPKWFAEGFTQWAELRALRKLGIVEGDLGEDPWYSESIRSVQELGDELPPVERILDDDLDELAFHPRYALQWLLAEAAAGMAEAPFAALCADIAALPSQPRLAGDLGDQFVERVGRGRLGTLDRGLRDNVHEQRPRWWEAIRSLARAEVDGERVFVQSSFGSKNALAFRLGPGAVTGSNRSLAFACELVGKVAGQQGPPQLNVLLDRQDGSFLSLALHGSGWVTVFEHTFDGNRWDVLGRGEASLPIGQRLDVTVVTTEGALTVSVGGEEVVRCEAERTWTGPWGIGAQAGSVGIWHHLPIE